MKFIKSLLLYSLTFSLSSFASASSCATTSEDKPAIKAAHITKETGHTFLFPIFVPGVSVSPTCPWTQYTVHSKDNRKSIAYRQTIDPFCLNSSLMYITEHPDAIDNITTSNTTKEKYEEIKALYLALKKER